MATLQVKGMDDQLYEALGIRAAFDNRSLSQEVIMIIKNFLAKPKTATEDATEAFLELAGSWEDERPASEIIKNIRSSRRSKRKPVSFD